MSHTSHRIMLSLILQYTLLADIREVIIDVDQPAGVNYSNNIVCMTFLVEIHK